MVLLIAGAVCGAAIVSNRVTERLHVPAPGVFLVAAAIAAGLVPGLHGALSTAAVAQLVSGALIFILFDGGMHIGWSRFREAAVPVLSLGVLGTFLTAGLAVLVAHYVLSLSWTVSAVIATAIAPTDPAVVFSVLGRREVVGRTATILEGESGANDPVGIALMIGVLAFTEGGHAKLWIVPETFAVQMAVGAAIGIIGGLGLARIMRSFALPNEGLYPLRTVVSALVIYGVASVLHGSGFLAVLIAGILVGDIRAPYKAEIERFHSAIASLAEIVIFLALGLTVDLGVLAQPRVWASGLVLAVLLAVVIRPVAIGPLLLPVRLHRGERIFVMWAGLKGAVPILLGAFAMLAGVPSADVVYGVVVVVVAFSVLVQGLTVPPVARWLGVPMHLVRPEPWDISVRLADEPRGVVRYRIAAGAPAAGREIGELPLEEDTWISFVIRGGRVLHARADCALESGDELLVLAEDEDEPRLRALFEAAPDAAAPAPEQPGTDTDPADSNLRR